MRNISTFIAIPLLILTGICVAVAEDTNISPQALGPMIGSVPPEPNGVSNGTRVIRNRPTTKVTDLSRRASYEQMTGSVPPEPPGVSNETKVIKKRPITRERARADARLQMVADQLVAPARGIQNVAVIEAMKAVPRHNFVPTTQIEDSYSDKALKIGHGAYIRQPYVIASIAEQLDPKPTDRILEIGSGSGYEAAVLSHVVKEVYLVEPPLLAGWMAQDIKRAGCTNVFVRGGDVLAGWPEPAPFDAIIVKCPIDKVPDALISQLGTNGRIIVPEEEKKALHILTKGGGKAQKISTLKMHLDPVSSTQE